MSFICLVAPGSANAGGAGNGAVQNGQAIGQGTGIANAGPGKYLYQLSLNRN